MYTKQNPDLPRTPIYRGYFLAPKHRGKSGFYCSIVNLILTKFPGYIELSKEIEKNQNNRHITDENITVPNHISKAACYVEDARDGRLVNITLYCKL